MRMSLMLLGLAGTAALAAYAKSRSSQSPHATPAPQPVRDAGPEHMDNPPRRWDQTDQQVDESFPASDPPGNY